MNKIRKQNPIGTLVTYRMIAEESNLGINTVMKLARESKSLVKIGRIARVDRDKFFEYLRDVYQAHAKD